MAAVTNKLASQVLQKAFENSQAQNAPTQGQGSSFQEMLKTTEETMEFVEALDIGEGKIASNGKAQSVSAEAVHFEADAEAFQSRAVGKQDQLMTMLSDFNDQQVHMDGLVNEILYGGKRFSNQELLAIQAHVFHVAQLTEMTVKSVELAVSSFKGVMNTQIQ